MSPPAASAAASAVRAPSPARPHERTLTPPARPRRISGPTRPNRPSRPARQRAGATPVARRRGLVEVLATGLARLAEHRLLTRLIAGKAWIAVVAFALIGIVTLQLGLLRLNTSIGRALEREGTLQRENAGLSIENSQLAAGERVESRATQLGMALVPEGALRFLGSRGGDLGRTLGALSTPVQPQEGRESSSAAGESSSSSSSSAAGGESSGAAAGSGGGSTSTRGEPATSGASAGREGEGARESARGELTGAGSGRGTAEAQPSSEASGAAGASEAGSASAPSQAAEGGERSAAGEPGTGPTG